MGQFGMGQAVRRTEDQRFVTGHGRYTDDITLPRQAHAHLLRSPHAHAVITRLDIEAAAASPGVLGIFTGADLAADGVGTLPCLAPIKSRDGSLAAFPPHPCLVSDRVRHVGDQIAFIVAETPEQARDAAELIEIDYDPLPAITGTARANQPGQSLVWDEIAANRCFDWEMGDDTGTRAAFARAKHIVRLDVVNNRVVVASMETRNAVGIYDAFDQRYTLYTSSQGAHTLREILAGGVLGVPEARIRVITPDVGGGFGMKLFLYPEQVLVLYAARKIGRPVKWSAERSEAFLTDTQGRDHVTHAELALDENARFLAARFETTANLGAYLSNYATFIPTLAGSAMLAGVYATPSVYVRVEGVFTNTTPVDAYRGAGRPEAAYVVERLVDKAARQLGLEPEELRRRNFIRPEQMPFRTAMGLVYDSGDFQKNLDDALLVADKAGLAARKAQSAARGKLRGLGIATYIEQCGGGGDEFAEIRFDGTGGLTLLIGTQSSGQGHQTAYAQIISERLGVPFEQIRVVQGDTDVISAGSGTGGSRSLPVGGMSTKLAIDKVIERGRKIAAHLLEAAEADIEFADGKFSIAGTDRLMALAEVVQAGIAGKVPPGMESGFDETARWKPPAGTFPNGTHVVELEIDAETGVPEILRYIVVDDFGTVVNPLLLAGQVHGGVVQGVGQALLEHVAWDPDSGQVLTGSFMDYGMPRADHLPAIEFSFNIIPCRTNPLGIKGAGEAGAIGAPPAVINALVDALAPLGIDHIDMPATPLAIWTAIRSARREAAE
jgi:carbon-monoxide dehydrogenase large subunit